MDNPVILRTQKVFKPFLTTNAQLGTLPINNIANENRIFATIKVLQALPAGVTLEVYADGKADDAEATATRLPVKLNDVVSSTTFATFSAVGTYEVEMDCSKFKKADFIIRFAGASGNLSFSTYLTCNIVVTNLLTIKIPDPLPEFFKTKFSVTSLTPIQTKNAKVLKLETVFTPSDALGTTAAEILTINNSTNLYIDPYNSYNKNRVVHANALTNANGKFLKVLSAGQGVAVKTIAYYDISEIQDFKVNFYVASGAGTLTVTGMFLDTAFVIPDPVVVPEPQFLKIPTTVLQNAIVQTKTAKVLRVESTFTPSDALSSTKQEFIVQNNGNSTFLDPYTQFNKSRVLHPLMVGTGTSKFLRVSSAGQGVAIKTVSYYDVSEIPEVKFNFYVLGGTGSITTSVMFLDTPFESLDPVVVPVVETQFLKASFALTSNATISTKNAKVLRVEFTSTANDALTTTATEAAAIDVATNLYAEPFDNYTEKRLVHPSVTGTGNLRFLKIKTGGQGVVVKTIAYYDVSEIPNIKMLFYASSGSITTTASGMFLDTPFEDMLPEKPTVYTGKSFVLETCKPVIDCYLNTFIHHLFRGSYIDISITGIDGTFERVLMNSTNFPNLKAGSEIFSAIVIPWTRNQEALKEQKGRDARICIVTTKGQVYHNFPSRGTGTDDGVALTGDHLKFDHSAMWDLATTQTVRKHPSTNSAESRDGYRYDPSLPAFAYEMEPAVNSDPFAYGNGGFPDVYVSGTVKRPRYYLFKQPDGVTTNTPFRVLSFNKVKSKKMTVLGTYQIEGSRVHVIGTTDGGRNWVVLYEFASLTTLGNPINLSALPAYTANSFAAEYRDFVVPTSAVKEPATKFTYAPEFVISSISATNPAVVTTVGNHGLSDKNLIRLKRKTAGSSGLEFMLNDTADTVSAGTGMFYMIKKLTNTTFELHEYIYSPDNNLRVRHIHYTHLLKDFIAFGTGEIYPEGWLMLLDAREKDASTLVNLLKETPASYRLNSSVDGVQRLCSFWMLDDHPTNPTVYFGSDAVNITRPELVIAGRTGLPRRSSTGVFKGKLADIDDMSKFTSVLDIEDVNLYCTDLNGIKIAGFMSDHNAISLDGGNTWEQFNVGRMLEVAWVDNRNYIYFNTGYRLRLTN